MSEKLQIGKLARAIIDTYDTNFTVHNVRLDIQHKIGRRLDYFERCCLTSYVHGRARNGKSIQFVRQTGMANGGKYNIFRRLDRAQVEG